MRAWDPKLVTGGVVVAVGIAALVLLTRAQETTLRAIAENPNSYDRSRVVLSGRVTGKEPAGGAFLIGYPDQFELDDGTATRGIAYDARAVIVKPKEGALVTVTARVARPVPISLGDELPRSRSSQPIQIVADKIEER